MKNSADLRGCCLPRLSASVDNTLLNLQKSSYPTKAEFTNNCFILKFKEFSHSFLGLYRNSRNFQCFTFSVGLRKQILLKADMKVSCFSQNVSTKGEKREYIGEVHVFPLFCKGWFTLWHKHKHKKSKKNMCEPELPKHKHKQKEWNLFHFLMLMLVLMLM